MKKFILICFMVLILTTITAFSIGSISSAKQYIAYEANFTIEIDGVERNFYHPIVSIDDKAYVALTDFASWTGRTTTWLPEQNKIRVAERNNDMSNKLIIYTDEVTGHQGFKDSEGNIVIEAKDEYTNVYPFKEGLAMVCDARRINPSPRYGFINRKSDLVIPIKYGTANDFQNGVAAVRTPYPNEGFDYTNDCWTFIKKDGSLLFDKEFKWADSFSEGFACILTQGIPAPTSDDGNKRYSYIDLSGERATDLEFEKASRFKNGYANVILNGVEGYIDSQFNFYEGKR